jgi:tetratricopeptide (TPR) repeat protein
MGTRRHVPLVLLAVNLAVFVAAGAAQAQVIRLAGTVRDDGGRAVRGAVIVAENPDQAPPRLTTTSNEKGQFGFIGIRRGVWTISVEAPGYEVVRFRRQVAPGPRQEPLDVRLAKTAVPASLPLDNTKASDIQERIDRAESLASNNDLDGAIAAWRDVLSKVPGLTSVHLRIGALYERKPDPERALAAYRQLLEIEPDNASARAAVDRLSAKKF